MQGLRVLIGLSVITLMLCFAPDQLGTGSIQVRCGRMGLEYRSAEVKTVDFIAINGNSDLLQQAASNGWPGNGSESNPVIISGYRIVNSRHLLRVINTDLHFVFVDCYLDGIDGTWCGLYLSNVTNGDIVNVTVTNAAIGLHMVEIENCTISHCTIYANDYEGIVLERACLFNNITHNTVYGNGSDGIVLDLHNQHNFVYNNTVADNRQSGIYLYHDSSDNKVLGNSVHRNRISGIRVNGDRSFVLENELSRQAGSGIFVTGAGNLISSNCIWNSTAYAVRLTLGASGNVVMNNTIAFSSLYGLALSSETIGNSVLFNDFFWNGLVRQGADEGQSNLFSHNYWNPWNSTDRNGDSVVDVPYPLDGQADESDESPSVFPCNPVPAWLHYAPNQPIQDPDVRLEITITTIAVLVVMVLAILMRRHSRA